MKTTSFKKSLIGTLTGVALLGSLHLDAANDAAKHETGKIVSVDAKARTLVVQATGEQKPQTFEWTASTKLNYHGIKGGEKDLKAGERVTVNYEASNGKMIAREINVLAQPAVKPAAAATKPATSAATKSKK